MKHDRERTDKLVRAIMKTAQGNDEATIILACAGVIATLVSRLPARLHEEGWDYVEGLIEALKSADVKANANAKRTTQ